MQRLMDAAAPAQESLVGLGVARREPAIRTPRVGRLLAVVWAARGLVLPSVALGATATGRPVADFAREPVAALQDTTCAGVECGYVAPLLDTARGPASPARPGARRGLRRVAGLRPCEDEGETDHPRGETPAVKRGADKPPTCHHGERRFAGAATSRGAAEWRCPTGECVPASRWIKADRLIPHLARESRHSKALSRGRAAVAQSSARRSPGV